MVAVSLMPPLASAGMLLGKGDIAGFSGAILLFFVNIVCVNLASIITFRLQGIEPARGGRRTRRAKPSG
jgi:uncharacterized membrane protein